MRPIPKKLLIHSAELKAVEKDEWQEETLTTVADLKHIRVEPASKLVTDKQNRQITITAVMFYDCRNSRPKAVEFAHGQKICWNGKTYSVEVIEPLYAGNRLHHYELGLV
ncbi:MAG: hypothetical protein E7500_00400 [Ruminococcus sp.]|nr:hypothetical protein [Ruminococcus sp.]